MRKSFSELIQDETPVLVDFSAAWCGPCKMMGPILKELKDYLGEQAHIIKIDVDENQQAAAAYNIQSVPTLMIFQNGEVKWRQAGVIPARQLQQIISPYLKK